MVCVCRHLYGMQHVKSFNLISAQDKTEVMLAILPAGSQSAVAAASHCLRQQCMSYCSSAVHCNLNHMVENAHEIDHAWQFINSLLCRRGNVDYECCHSDESLMLAHRPRQNLATKIDAVAVGSTAAIQQRDASLQLAGNDIGHNDGSKAVSADPADAATSGIQLAVVHDIHLCSKDCLVGLHNAPGENIDQAFWTLPRPCEIFHASSRFRETRSLERQEIDDFHAANRRHRGCA